MFRWILSVLALVGYTGMAAQAQQTPQSDHSNSTLTQFPDLQHGNVIGDGTTQP